MPRPKRTKVASKLAVSRVAQNPLARVSSDAGTEVSDDSQGFITTKKTRVTRGKHQSDEIDLTMSGAGPILLEAVEAQAKSKRPRKTIKRRELGAEQAETLEALKRRKDEAKVTQASSRAAVAQPANASTKSSQSALAIPVHKPRASTTRQTPIPNASQKSKNQAVVMEESELSLPSPSLGEHSFDSESPQSIRKPQSALKLRGTPGAEASILALGNFKRRPRQPSILRMVQQPSDNDTTDLDLDNFTPDDESTPINLRTVPMQQSRYNDNSDALRTSSSRKRKRMSPEVRPSPRKSTSTLQTKAHDEASEVQVVCSSPPAISSPTYARVPTAPTTDPPSSLPSVIEQSQPDEPPSNNEPDIFSETMAPPMSSSPPPPTAPASPPKTKRGRKVAPGTADTARLQSLLPRRRARARRGENVFDIISSSDADEASHDPEDDELSRPNHRRVTALSYKTPARGNAANNKKRGRPGGTGKSKTKGKSALMETTTVSPLKSAKSGKRVSKTYGRSASSDKENCGSSFAIVADENDKEEDNELPGEGGSSMISDEGSRRLQAMKKKFEEVDEWEMEFESVDVGGQSSSPWR